MNHIDDDFKELIEEKLDTKKYNIQLISLCIFISSFLITILYNLNINFYLKSFIIPITITLINYLILITNHKLVKNKKAYYLLIPIILILVSDVLIKIDFSNKVLNIFIVTILISTFLLYLINQNFTFSRKIFTSFFQLFPKKLLTNLNNLNSLFKNKKGKHRKVLNILIGLVISIPIAIILLSLLADADMYFNFFIKDILDGLKSIFNIHFLRKNIFILVISFIIIFSIFINLMKSIGKKEKKVKTYHIESSIISTILFVVNLVFVLFLISEISKLTTNFLKSPLEYTYSEYAREGFFQLLFVTSINGIITLFCLYYTRLINDNKLIKNLLLILISFSIILIFNSYYRMFLYISAYTFTILRLQVILFLTLELIIFILLMKRTIYKIKKNDIQTFSILSLSFYILNLYLCNDFVIHFINCFLN